VKLLAIPHPLNGVQRLLLSAWVGGMWAIGYVVAPVLFSSLDSRMQAGAIAGVLFTMLSWIGLVCGALILLLQLKARVGGMARAAWICVVLMLVITAIGQFGIQPIMAEMKTHVAPGTEMSGALRERFGMWHGISSILFLCSSVLGALAIWRSAPPAR